MQAVNTQYNAGECSGIYHGVLGVDESNSFGMYITSEDAVTTTDTSSSYRSSVHATADDNDSVQYFGDLRSDPYIVDTIQFNYTTVPATVYKMAMLALRKNEETDLKGNYNRQRGGYQI
jgi:hypothetical protein